MSELWSQSANHLAAIGAQILNWAPDTFWAATPSELAAALQDLRPLPGGSTLSRTELDTLVEQDRNG